MEAAREGDDGLAAGGGAGDLHGVFNGFGTGRDEDRLLGKVTGGDGVQALGEFDIVFVRNDLVAGVGETVELLLDGFDDARVAVAGVDDGDTRGEVDVAIAFLVPDFRVLCTVGVDLRGHADAARNGGILAIGKGRGGHGAILNLEAWFNNLHFFCKSQVEFLHFFCKNAIRILRRQCDGF